MDSVIQGVKPKPRLLLGLAAQVASPVQRLPPRQQHARFHLRRNRRFFGRSPRFVRSGMLVQAGSSLHLMKTCFRQGTFAPRSLLASTLLCPPPTPAAARRRLCFPRQRSRGTRPSSSLPRQVSQVPVWASVRTPAVPFHPGEPRPAAFARLASRSASGFTSLAGWPLFAFVTRPKWVLRLQHYGWRGRLPGLRPTGSPRRTCRVNFYGARASAMTSTFQLIKLNRLTDAPKSKRKDRKMDDGKMLTSRRSCPHVPVNNLPVNSFAPWWLCLRLLCAAPLRGSTGCNRVTGAARPRSARHVRFDAERRNEEWTTRIYATPTTFEG